ncbi:MAG: hypothetical protein ABR616_15460 [Dermatophilaceae bacterium]
MTERILARVLCLLRLHLEGRPVRHGALVWYACEWCGRRRYTAGEPPEVTW